MQSKHASVSSSNTHNGCNYVGRTGAVGCNPCLTGVTDASIETVVKQWLRFAADRDGGRLMRDQRRRQELAAQSDV